jgi:hypothetical protein
VDARTKPPGPLRATALALRFLLELTALGALAVWGFTMDASLPLRVLTGIGAPLVAAVAWGLFVSPKAKIPVSPATRYAIELLVFVTAFFAIAAAGSPSIGFTFLVVAVIDGIVVRRTA